MTLKQLQKPRLQSTRTSQTTSTVHTMTSEAWEQLLNYGIILLDKPPGPTSHETVAWAKRILKLPKIGHSGTLDPQVSGVLPLGLGEATKALGVLLLGPKSTMHWGRMHSMPSDQNLGDMLALFSGRDIPKAPRSALLFCAEPEHGTSTSWICWSKRRG